MSGLVVQLWDYHESCVAMWDENGNISDDPAATVFRADIGGACPPKYLAWHRNVNVGYMLT